MGSYRHLDHEMQEAGLRSYFRESKEPFAIVEPSLTSGLTRSAEEAAKRLLSTDMNLVGLYLSGGALLVSAQN